MSKYQKYKGIFFRKVNGYLNKASRKNKVFCIGLHKTGTTTLANLFKKYGFNTIHSTDWQNDIDRLSRYEFFSDGGSHFNDINEFDIIKLLKKFPNAKFILQTRDTEKWIVSKLKHAGWSENTVTIEKNQSSLRHEDWKIKSYQVVKNLLIHKLDYEKKIENYFNKNHPNKLIIINITDKNNQLNHFNKLKKYLNLKSINKINIPHSNKQKRKTNLPIDVLDFIDDFLKNSNTYR